MNNILNGTQRKAYTQLDELNNIKTEHERLKVHYEQRGG